MQPHHRTAVALRVVRASGGRVRVQSRGATIAFHVTSPCEAPAVRELVAAGFRTTVPFAHPPGWLHTLMVPTSARMTAALLALDGTGPLDSEGDATLTRAGVGCESAPEDARGDGDDAPADGAVVGQGNAADAPGWAA